MKNKIIIFTIAISIMLLLLGGVFGFYISNKSQYKVSPLVYGVERVEKLNNANFTCGCYSTDSPLRPFYFDDEGIYEDPPTK